MTRLGLALCVVGSVACGGPNWKGIFTGTETEVQACNDGQGGTQSSASELDIGVNGSQIFFPVGCGIALTASTKNDVATIIPTACLPETANGITGVTEFTGGTLTINGDTITENVTATFATADGGLTCKDTLTGTFARQN